MLQFILRMMSRHDWQRGRESFEWQQEQIFVRCEFLRTYAQTKLSDNSTSVDSDPHARNIDTDTPGADLSAPSPRLTISVHPPKMPVSVDPKTPDASFSKLVDKDDQEGDERVSISTNVWYLPDLLAILLTILSIYRLQVLTLWMIVILFRMLLYSQRENERLRSDLEVVRIELLPKHIDLEEQINEAQADEKAKTQADLDIEPLTDNKDVSRLETTDKIPPNDKNGGQAHSDQWEMASKEEFDAVNQHFQVGAEVALIDTAGADINANKNLLARTKSLELQLEDMTTEASRLQAILQSNTFQRGMMFGDDRTPQLDTIQAKLTMAMADADGLRKQRDALRQAVYLDVEQGPVEKLPYFCEDPMTLTRHNSNLSKQLVACRGELSDARTEISACTDKYEAAERTIASLRSELDSKAGDLKVCQTSVQNYQGELLSAYAKLDRAEKDRDQILKSYHWAQYELTRKPEVPKVYEAKEELENVRATDTLQVHDPTLLPSLFRMPTTATVAASVESSLEALSYGNRYGRRMLESKDKSDLSLIAP